MSFLKGMIESTVAGLNREAPGDSAMSNMAQTKGSLEDVLEQSWNYVQEKLCCFDLSYPIIKEVCGTDTACIDMATHQITLNRKFIDVLNSKGLDYNTIFKGLLSHEAGHFKIIPWDMKNYLLMLYAAEKECGADRRDTITNYFADISLNLHLLLKKQEDSIRSIYYALDKDSRIDSLIANLYHLKTNLDFNEPKLSLELGKKLKQLGAIRFTETADKEMYKNLRKFARIINDVLDEEKKENDLHDTDSESITNLGKYTVSGLDSSPINGASKDDFEKALKEIGEGLTSPSDYDRIYRFVKRLEGENRSPDYCIMICGAGPGANGAGAEPMDSLVDFYSIQAEAYEIAVENRDVFSGSQQGRSQIKEWEVDEPYSSVDVFKSYGRFFPGFSKSWKEAEADGQQKVKDTPDLLVIIDSSLSMANPADELSSAGLGAVCMARQYLKRGRSVAVANFSYATRITGFSSDYSAVVRSILYYQGGGTQFDTSAISRVIRKNNKDVDMLMVSDGFIYNLDSVMKTFNSLLNTNRITVVEIDEAFDESDPTSGGGFTISGMVEKYSKVKFYAVSKAEDIPKIVVHDMVSSGVI
jgi:hypothetical protein